MSAEETISEPRRRKPKFGFGALALLDWLTETGPDARFYSRHEGTIWLYERKMNPDGTAEVERIWPATRNMTKAEEIATLDRFGGRIDVEEIVLGRNGLIRSFTQTPETSEIGRHQMADFRRNVDRFGGEQNFLYREVICEPTPEAFSFMAEHGAAMLAALRTRRSQQRAAVERRVVIGSDRWIEPRLPPEMLAQIPKGVNLPLPARRMRIAYASATIVRETGTRFYIRDVELLTEHGSNPISGNEPNQYVDRSAIIADHADETLGERLAAIDQDFQQGFDAIGSELVARILPFVAETHSRVLQKEAERADLISEALAQSSSARPPAP